MAGAESSTELRQEVLRRRLAVQHLVGDGLPTATDVVRLLTCVQSQEYAHGFWSLGMRAAGRTFADIRREFDEGRFVRTHVLRPTWHFMAAADVRWILRLTSPRVLKINGPRCRQLELDPATLERGNAVLLDAVSDHQYLTRPELGTRLEAAGISSTGQRLAYLVMTAELTGLICSGPMRGSQHTYAALDERLPATPVKSEEDSLRDLVLAYVSGHGPTSMKDFTRWSSLTLATAEQGLEAARDRLERVLVDGQELWFDPTAGEPATATGRALLLPLYDEATLSYPQLSFPRAPGHPHLPGTDLFIGSVVVDLVNVGTWRRTVKGRHVLVETALAPSVTVRQRRAVDEAVSRLAAFLEKDLEVVSPVG